MIRQETEIMSSNISTVVYWVKRNPVNESSQQYGETNLTPAKKTLHIFISLQSTLRVLENKKKKNNLFETTWNILGWKSFNLPETGANMYRQVLMSLLKTSVFLDKV